MTRSQPCQAACSAARNSRWPRPLVPASPHVMCKSAAALTFGKTILAKLTPASAQKNLVHRIWWISRFDCVAPAGSCRYAGYVQAMCTTIAGWPAVRSGWLAALCSCTAGWLTVSADLSMPCTGSSNRSKFSRFRSFRLCLTLLSMSFTSRTCTPYQVHRHACI